MTQPQNTENMPCCSCTERNITSDCRTAPPHAFIDALELGDRIAVIEDGRIVAEGPPDEMLAEENGFVSHFFFGCTHERKGAEGAQKGTCDTIL